jgi:autotransporter-associated beta strand protein
MRSTGIVAAGIVVGLLLAVGPARAAWQTYDATTQNYTNTANWAGGVIDDVFSSSSTAWVQTINVTADRTLSNGLSITRNPATTADGNVVFQGSGGDRTFILGGNLNFTGNNTRTKLVQLGANTAGSRLILDLGSQTRTVNVSTQSYDDGSRGYGFVVFGPVAGTLGLTKAGDGDLTFWGTNTQTFTGPLAITRGQVILTDKVQLATTNVSLRNTLNNLTGLPTDRAFVSSLQSNNRNVGGYGFTANRLAPATTLTMDGGLFRLRQNNTDTSEISTERVANLVLLDGLAQIDATTRAATTKNASFAIDALSRPHNAPMAFSVDNGGGVYSTMSFGTGAGQFKVSLGNYDAGWSKGGILPFAVIGDVSTYLAPDNIYAPAAYDNVNGLVKPAPVTNLANLAAGQAGDNARISLTTVNDESVPNGATVTLNALIIDTSAAGSVNVGASGNAGTVKLTSGQLVHANRQDSKLTRAFVKFDMNGEHAYVFSGLKGSFSIREGGITNASGATFAAGNGSSIELQQTYAGWTGETTVAQGVLVAHSSNVNGLPTSSRVNIASGAYFDGNWGPMTFGSLAGAGAIKTFRGLYIGTDNTDSEFSGQIHANGIHAAFLTKVGTGRLTLSGQCYYTGATTNAGGGLVINGSLSASANAVTVQNSAYLGGTGTIARAVTVESGGRLTGGLTNAVGTLNIASNLNLKAGAILDVQLAGGGVCDTIVVGGAVDLNSDSGAGSALQISAVGTLKGSETYTIMRAGSPIVNTFANGSSLSVGGRKLRIDYAGETGNDVVLTVLSEGTLISIR